MPLHEKYDFRNKNTQVEGHIVKMSFNDNSGKSIKFEGIEKLEGYYNYFIGNDETKWASNVPLFNEVIIKDVYEGIDVKYYFKGNSLRYDFIINPGANPTLVKMFFEGQNNIFINENGDLVYLTRFGEVKNSELFAYQESNRNKNKIECSFAQDKENFISFKLGEFDKTKVLIIDPLIYSTFLGGSSCDEGYTIKINSTGNAFIAGYTESTNFPTIVGSYDVSYNSISDAFVTKLNTDGTGLVFSTYLGGSNSDWASSITIDDLSNSYITGATRSSNFPSTAGAFDVSYNGNGNSSDIFVTKLNSLGTSLTYSTFIGGETEDIGTGIVVDNNGNTFVTGYTGSFEYPKTPNAFDTILNTGGIYNTYDAFITKLNSSGSSLLYSTYLGGTNEDRASSIVIDNDGNAYIGGYTTSLDFPTTPNAYNMIFNGLVDIFITKIDSYGNSLVYSTYFGAPNWDDCSSITIDSANNIYLTGKTNSNSFPTTSQAYNTVLSGSYDAYVSKLNSYGTNLIYSTFLGGVSSDNGIAIDVDNLGNSYITGYTNSNETTFPITPGAISMVKKNGTDAFMSLFNSNGSALVYSTYLGSNSGDYGNSIAVNSLGQAYIAGATYATVANDFPISAGAYQTTPGGSGDAFALKLEPVASNSIITGQLSSLNYNPGSTISVPYTVYGTYNTNNTFTIQLSDWNQNFNNPTNIGSILSQTSGSINGIIPANTVSGAYRVRVVSSNPVVIGSNNGADILIYPPTYPIQTNQLSFDSYYQGSYLNVSFTTDSSFNSNNVFSVQLSNSSGDFSNPTTIGSLVSQNARAVIAKIPNNTILGSGYRLRVVSSNPALIGGDNGSNFSVTSHPLSLLLPSDSTQHTTMPIFTWQTVSGATNYRIQLFNDILMNQPTYGESVGNNTQSPTTTGWVNNWNNIPLNQTIFWSVSYYNGSYWSDYAPVRTITKIPGNPPQITISPNDTLKIGPGIGNILTITNTGGGYLSWSIPNEWKTEWLNVSPQSGELQSNQVSHILISGTPPSTNYNGIVTILNNAGENIIKNVKFSLDPQDFNSSNWLPSQPEVGIGINPINGTFSHYEKTTFSIPGASFDLDFEHAYNTPNGMTFRPVPSSVGISWLHNYSYIIEKLPEIAIVYEPDGNINHYQWMQSYYKSLTPGCYDTIYTVNNIFYLKTKSQVIYKFETIGTNTTIYYLKSIKDRNNNEMTLNYDSQQRLISVTSPESRSLTFEYYPTNSNWPNFIKYVKDNINRKAEFIYDFPNNNLIKYINLMNDTTFYEYNTASDETHLLKKIKLPKGNWIDNTYNDKRIASQSVSGLPGSLIVTQQSPTSYQVQDQLNNITKYEYSAAKFGNVTKIISPTKDSIIYEYNDALNKTLPTKVIDAIGNWTSYSYDYKGNTLKVTKPYNIKYQYQYNTRNDVTQFTDPRNKIYSYGYDGSGNLTSMQTPRGTSTLTYNSNGTVNNVTNPLNRTIHYAYNSYGNVASVTDNLGNTTTNLYDNVSRITSSTNAKNQQINYTYLNNDLLHAVKDPMNDSVNYVYDKNDNLINFIDPNNHTTQFEFDSSDFFRKRINPLNQQTQFNYDNRGLISNRITPNGHQFNFVYDSSARLTSITGAKQCEFTYLKNGLLNQAKFTNGPQVQYQYDSLNRVISYNNSINGNTISYTYDLASNISTIVYPGNRVVTYQYCDDNLLKSVTDWNNRTTSYNYLADGSLDSVLNANGTVTKYRYDNGGRLTDILNRKSNGDTISSYKYTLDNIGNILELEYKEPLSKPSMTSLESQYTYNEANQLISESNSFYTYDNNGNTISKSGADSVFCAYNVDDKLIYLKISNNVRHYEYDIFNNRTGAKRNGVKKNYTINGNNSMSYTLMEVDSATGETFFYVYGNSLISRIKINGTTNWYHYDNRANTIAMTDINQNITHKYCYDAYGKLLDKQEPAADTNLYRFLGAYGITDEGNNIYWIRARFYDANTGRFLTEDPQWNSNLYAYGGDNPVQMIDVDGNSVVVFIALAAGWIALLKSAEIVAEPATKAYYSSQTASKLPIGQDKELFTAKSGHHLAETTVQTELQIAEHVKNNNISKIVPKSVNAIIDSKTIYDETRKLNSSEQNTKVRKIDLRTKNETSQSKKGVTRRPVKKSKK